MGLKKLADTSSVPPRNSLLRASILVTGVRTLDEALICIEFDRKSKQGSTTVDLPNSNDTSTPRLVSCKEWKVDHRHLGTRIQIEQFVDLECRIKSTSKLEQDITGPREVREAA